MIAFKKIIPYFSITVLADLIYKVFKDFGIIEKLCREPHQLFAL